MSILYEVLVMWGSVRCVGSFESWSHLSLSVSSWSLARLYSIGYKDTEIMHEEKFIKMNTIF